MYKTMGGGSWTGLWNTDKLEMESFEFAPECGLTPDEGCGLTPEELALLKGEGGTGGAAANADGEAMDEAIAAVTGQFSLAWQSLKQVQY